MNDRVTIRSHLLFSFLIHAVFLTFVLSLPLYRGSLNFSSFGIHSVYLAQEEGKKIARILSPYKTEEPKTGVHDKPQNIDRKLETTEVIAKEESKEEKKHLKENKQKTFEEKSVIVKEEAKKKEVPKVIIEEETEKTPEIDQIVKVEEPIVIEEEIKLAKKEEPEIKEPKETATVMKEPPLEKDPQETIQPIPAVISPEKEKGTSLEPLNEKQILPSLETPKEEIMYLEDEKVEEQKKVAQKKENLQKIKTEPQKVFEIEESVSLKFKKIAKKKATQGGKRETEVNKPGGESKTKVSMQVSTKDDSKENQKEKISKNVTTKEKSEETLSLQTKKLETDREESPIIQSKKHITEPSEKKIKGETVPLMEIGASVAEPLIFGSDISSLLKEASIPEKEVIKIQPVVEKKTDSKEEKKPDLGIPVPDVFFAKDIVIEIFLKDIETTDIHSTVLKKLHPLDRRRGSSDRQNEADGLEEKDETSFGFINRVKRVLSVSKAGKGTYTLIVENIKRETFEVDIIFRIFEGKAEERIKEVKSLELKPNVRVKYKFILPEAIFWDDEYHFTGIIEDSDTMTKFNDITGLLWKEEKDY